MFSGSRHATRVIARVAASHDAVRFAMGRRMIARFVRLPHPKRVMAGGPRMTRCRGGLLPRRSWCWPREATGSHPCGAVPDLTQSNVMSVRPDRLVSQLQAARSVPLVLLVAPAGYGKTTLLERWDAADERPFMWTSASGLSDEVDALDQPAVVVVDDWHDDGAAGALRDAGPAIAALCPARRLPSPRAPSPTYPSGACGRSAKLLELRGPDLALRHEESASLLHDGGLDLAPGQVKTLGQRTEGWPAALVLAALSLRDRPDIDAAIAAFGGGDRLVADYLRDEVLGGLAPSALAFLRDTACLDRLSGPLCDAVADRRGSALILRELSRAGVGVLALDGNDEAYRYHPLLAGMLCAELERMDPDSLRERHRRATAWYAAEGETESALHHAVAAGDADAAGALLWATAPRWASDGHVATLRRWLARFSDREIATTSTLGLAAAVGHLAMGEGDLADRRTTVLSTRTELAGGLELLHAALGRERGAGDGAVGRPGALLRRRGHRGSRRELPGRRGGATPDRRAPRRPRPAGGRRSLRRADRPRRAGALPRAARAPRR